MHRSATACRKIRKIDVDLHVANLGLTHLSNRSSRYYHCDECAMSVATPPLGSNRIGRHAHGHWLYTRKDGEDGKTSVGPRADNCQNCIILYQRVP